MFSFNIVRYIKTLTRSGLLNSMATVVYALVILTLPLVVVSMMWGKKR
jgi:hypothetical protein